MVFESIVLSRYSRRACLSTQVLRSVLGSWNATRFLPVVGFDSAQPTNQSRVERSRNSSAWVHSRSKITLVRVGDFASLAAMCGFCLGRGFANALLGEPEEREPRHNRR